MVTSEAQAPVKSLYPKDGEHKVTLSRFTFSLAQRVASGRDDPGPRASFHSHLATYLPHLTETEREKLFQEFWTLLLQDEVRDSEERQAHRAVQPVLKSNLPLLKSRAYKSDDLLITGWLPGATLRRGYDLFTFTGGACPRCEVNPLAHGNGGGVRCLATDTCGWWYCA